jgi:small-conductance mechanosensitive channel
LRELLSGPITIGNYTFHFSVYELITEFLFPVIAYVLAALLIRLILLRVIRRHVHQKKYKLLIELWSRRIVRTLVTLGVLLSGLSLFGSRVYGFLGRVFDVLNKPFFTTGNTKISVITLVLIVPIFVFASRIGKRISNRLNSRSFKRLGLDAERSFSMSRLFGYSITVLVFLIGASVVGFDLSTFGVIFGVLGIGIGFGLQTLVADFFSGISLIGMSLIKEGDRINVSGFDGIITNIRLVNIELTTFENETIIIPNRLLTGGPFRNYSHNDRRIIIVNEVNVSYRSDLDEVSRILKGVGSSNPWAVKELEPVVRVRNLAESGVTMQLRTWIGDYLDRPEALSWTNLEILKAFAKNQVEIPFPQRVVHYKGCETDSKTLNNDGLPEPADRY